MSRINTNIPSVIAQSNLNRTQAELQTRLERLSTGLRINRGKDDPAGLIISERLRSNVQGVEAAVKNSERASAMIATTEASLAEVNDLLNSIRALIVESASTGANSEAERQANQLQIDSAIASITRISNTASFGSLKLLNGSLDYTVENQRTSTITTARINNASFVETSNISVTVDVVASAQTGALFFNSSALTPPGITQSSMTLEIAGRTGVQTITVGSGISVTNVVNAVNAISQLTGVEARLINGNPLSGIVFSSIDYGADGFVSVKRLGGPSNPAADSWRTLRLANNQPFYIPSPAAFAALESSGQLEVATRDVGRDVSALVNGNLASGRGLNVLMNTPSLSLEVMLSEDFGTRPTLANTTFNVVGGGAIFQIGPDVNALQQTNIGIASVAASKLGGALVNGTVQYLSSLSDGQGNSIRESVARGSFQAAQEILAKAIDQITILRGRLGAFERNVLDTNQRSMQSQFENLTASESAIRDADFAFETSRLTRAQILASAGTSTLTLANQQSQQVLQLLG